MDSYFITGPVGVGKTYTAKEVLQGYQAEYLDEVADDVSARPAKELFGFYSCGQVALRSRISRVANELFDEMVSKRVVVLDDLGAFKSSDYTIDVIYLVIDERLNRKKTTIVTSNLSLEEVADRVDDRLASRLSSFKLIEMKGEDRRNGIN